MPALPSPVPEAFRTNLSSGEFARSRLVAATLYALALVGIVVAIGLVWWATGLRREATALEENVARAHRQSSRLREELRQAGFAPDDSAAVERLVRQVDGLNQIIDAKSFSWTALMNDLEAVVPRNVSVKSIRPDLKTKKVTFDGVALTLQDVTALMTALQTSGRFGDVFLQQQKATDENRTEFAIECVYRGGTQ
jgi:type IV pilus assembly protein PilN